MTNLVRCGLLCALLFLPAVAQADPWVGRFTLRELPLMKRVLLVVEPDGLPGRYRVERRSAGPTVRGTAVLRSGRLEVDYPDGRGMADILRGLAGRDAAATYQRRDGRLYGSTWLPGALSVRYELGDRLEPARAPAQLEGRLRVAGAALRDPFGRDVLLRGVNVGLKRAPFLPPHDRAAIDALVAATGVNLVRFSIAWRAIEPEPLRYDTAYLDQVAEAVRRWSDAGVYVLVDMHQDVWGGPFAGHGAPQWATLGLGAKELALPDGAPWQANYLNPRCYESFEALWANRRLPASGLGLQEHYGRAWAQVAQRLRGVERVVGYDLINEPFYGREVKSALRGILTAALWRAGDLRFLGGAGFSALRALFTGDGLQDALLEQVMLHAKRPAVFDALARGAAGATQRFERRLSSFYGRVGRAVRAADPGRPLFLEPMALAGVGVPSRLRDPGLGQLVYAPHLYDPFVDSGLGNDGNLARVRRSLQRSARTARRLGWPLVFGEWGNVHGDDLVAFARGNGELLDGALAGSAYWDHVPGRESNRAFMEAMRPYPRRIAGTLRSLRWDAGGRTLTVAYRARGLRHPTVIQLHPGAFPRGVTVEVDDPWSEHEVRDQQVLVWSPRGGSVTVRVRAR